MKLKNFLVLIYFCTFGSAGPVNSHNDLSKRVFVDENDRLCVQKCKEYTSQVTPRPRAGSLSVGSRSRSISAKTCSFSQGLITGGKAAKPGEFPHMAAIGYVDIEEQFKIKCGGSLISEKFVLTAAHCKHHESKIVRLGCVNVQTGDENSRPQDFDIENFIVHEKYNSETKKNDIAVVKLSRSVTFSNHIRPACLSTKTMLSNRLKVIATGWGVTEAFGDSSDILQKVTLSVVNTNKCRELLKGQDLTLDKTQICAGVNRGGKDTCQGDSGGPLQAYSYEHACMYDIVGVTSFGSVLCGAPNSPGTYTSVSSFLDWIENNVWR